MFLQEIFLKTNALRLILGHSLVHMHILANTLHSYKRLCMALPVSTATVEGTFSRMTLIKTRLRNRLSDSSLEHLMKIAIEGTRLRNRLSDSDLEHLMKIAIEGTRLRNRLSDSDLEHLMKIAIEGTRLHNRLSDSDLEHLTKIAIEGPSVSNVDFNETLDIFKQKNRRTLL